MKSKSKPSPKSSGTAAQKRARRGGESVQNQPTKKKHAPKSLDIPSAKTVSAQSLPKKETGRPPKRQRNPPTKVISLRKHLQKIDFVQTMIDRGFLFQTTDEQGLRDYMRQENPVAYIGFDCTAPSLHVGSLVQIMMLRWFQRAGGTPIVLLGSGTTRIGDPSGKDTQRPLLSPNTIRQFKTKIGDVFSRFVDFETPPNAAITVDNSAWLQKKKLGLIEFLETVGRHYTINKLVTLESMQRRLEREQPLTFLEFNYPLLQAFDFLHLSRPPYNCRLQMGGSDQWGNIIQGIELCRRVGGTECFGLTSPLITTASGAKMGKTAEGAVWLSAEYKSPYEYWQFWRNTEDADVGRFLKLFTDLPLDEIARLQALQGGEINDAKKVLATEATALLHGREEATKAEQAARATFEQGVISANLPTFSVTQKELAQGLRVAAAFVRAELVASNGEAKRQIVQKSLRVNDELVTDETATLTPAHLRDGAIKLSLGKKKHALLRV